MLNEGERPGFLSWPCHFPAFDSRPQLALQTPAGRGGLQDALLLVGLVRELVSVG